MKARKPSFESHSQRLFEFNGFKADQWSAEPSNLPKPGPRYINVEDGRWKKWKTSWNNLKNENKQIQSESKQIGQNTIKSAENWEEAKKKIGKSNSSGTSWIEDVLEKRVAHAYQKIGLGSRQMADQWSEPPCVPEKIN